MMRERRETKSKKKGVLTIVDEAEWWEEEGR
jgi:hypothetical protein